MKIKVVTTTDEAYKDALSVRKEVFVNEQNVSEDLEVDHLEDTATHFVLYDTENHPIGAGRMRPIEDGGKVERVCIISNRRKQGLGDLLMKGMEQEAVRLNYPALTLYAQVQAEDFYKKLGYTTTSKEPFIDANILHVAMKKALN
ncbi:GNAT family N-acetyltransferase [Fictibacillus fluitans]|uniref:GNAT family N-acetyltransferase n=1 Tax=Fictibacillus fluitans TaxID=3058422 RepID=A0ABT8HS90_9BACL|nr:GNAT family N-acetyltransferase [Fictibacillus sp. NE201]MDN4523609.1 GNAT family N-acetyltransferase [Fictibacillus sp. NE201]